MLPIVLDVDVVDFSGHWGSPSTGLTPKLIDIYNDVKEVAGEDSIEIIYVASDRKCYEKRFETCLGYMPWKAIPMKNKSITRHLSHRFGIRGIPTLVVLDGESGIVVSSKGKLDFSTHGSDPQKLLQHWKEMREKAIKAAEEKDEDGEVSEM